MSFTGSFTAPEARVAAMLCSVLRAATYGPNPFGGVGSALLWPGGVRVTERTSALADVAAFRRSVHLEGAHLIGEAPVKLRLSLPPGGTEAVGPVLLQRRELRLDVGLEAGDRGRNLTAAGI